VRCNSHFTDMVAIRDMSRGKLGCIGCCAVTVLVLAVMIPVSIFSIMPSMAQSNLKKATINITNSTVYMPQNLTAHPWVYQETHAIMYNHAPFEATMKPFKQTMTAVDWRNMGWFGPSRRVVIGEVVFPEVKLKKGENHVHVFMNISVNNANNKDCKYYDLFGWTCFFDYQMYTTQWGGPGGLELESDDARMKVLGFTIPGKFHSKKHMACTKIASPEYPMNLSNVPACVESGGCNPLIGSMACEQVDEFKMCDEDSSVPGYVCGTTTTTTASTTSTPQVTVAI